MTLVQARLEGPSFGKGQPFSLTLLQGTMMSPLTKTLLFALTLGFMANARKRRWLEHPTDPSQNRLMDQGQGSSSK